MREPVYDPLHREHGTPQVRDGLDLVPSWLDSYCRGESGFDVHLLGWRWLGEGPGINACACFERDTKRRMLPKPKFRREPRCLNAQGDAAGEMQFAVLVDVVQLADVSEGCTDLSCDAVAPSLVRLNPLDRCPLAFRELLDPSPLARRQRVALLVKGLRVEDREAEFLATEAGMLSSPR